MDRTKGKFILLLFFTVLLAACNMPLPQATSDPQVLAEVVAATLTAVASSPEVTPQPPVVDPESLDIPANTAEPKDLLVDASLLRVVYVKDGNTWLWSPQGDPIQLTEAGNVVDVRLSSDGLTVAMLRQVDEFHQELWAVDTDGEVERLLVSTADLDAMNADDRSPEAVAVNPYRFEWMPGTHILAFNTRQVFQGPGLAIMNDVRLVDADTQEQSTLLPPGEGGQFFFSPNGSQLAVVTPTDISLVNSDGSSRRDGVLTFERILTYSEFEFYPEPIWAPDGSALRVAIPPADPLADPSQPTTLHLIQTDGSPAVETASLNTLPLMPVVISPDLTGVAYLQQVGDPAGNLRELHIVAPDGSENGVYETAPLLEFMSWSTDGSHFAFRVGDPCTVNIAQRSGGYAPLDGACEVINLAWIGAEHFLFVLQNGEASELRLGTKDGSSLLIDTAGPNFDFIG